MNSFFFYHRCFQTAVSFVYCRANASGYVAMQDRLFCLCFQNLESVARWPGLHSEEEESIPGWTAAAPEQRGHQDERQTESPLQ